MSFFEQAFDAMTMGEIICRLPGLSKLESIRSHINQVLSGESVDDILETFEENTHPKLFQWMSSDNSLRVKDEGIDKIDVKFTFNLTKSDDLDGLGDVLNIVLAEDSADAPKIQAVLEKATADVFNNLINKVLKDERELVRAIPICLSYRQRKNLTDHQKLISLKAYASSMPGRTIDVLDFKLFSQLRAGERYSVLSTYLGQFPSYRKYKCFDPMPSETEFDVLLFAGSIDDHELIGAIRKKFEAVTKLDPPATDDSEEEDE